MKGCFCFWPARLEGKQGEGKADWIAQHLSQHHTGYSVVSILAATLLYSPVFRDMQLKLHYNNVFLAKM